MTDIPPTRQDADDLETAMWRAGNAALASSGPARDGLARLAAGLRDLRDMTELHLSGDRPDPAAWPETEVP